MQSGTSGLKSNKSNIKDVGAGLRCEPFDDATGSSADKRTHNLAQRDSNQYCDVTSECRKEVLVELWQCSSFITEG